MSGWRRIVGRTASSGGREDGGKFRDPRWDNARFFAGTLVVLVHMSNTAAESDGLGWLYLATWAMRVPLFAVLAGYFSSTAPLTAREARRLIESVLVPYLAIGLLHTAQIWLFSRRLELFVVTPAWGLWFLLSLLFWRLALPYLAHLRYPLLSAVVIAVLAGYVTDLAIMLSLSRTLTFLPFFLLGWRLREGGLGEVLRARWSRNAALAVVTVTFVTAWFLRDDVEQDWLRMKGPYSVGQPFDDPWGWAVRLAVLVCGGVIALSALRLVPARRLPLVTALGAGGLSIYLLHPLVLRTMNEVLGGFDWVGPWHEQLALIGLAVAISAALGSPPVRRLARPLVQPRLPWLFAPQAPGGPGAGRPAAGGTVTTEVVTVPASTVPAVPTLPGAFPVTTATAALLVTAPRGSATGEPGFAGDQARPTPPAHTAPGVGA